MPGAKDKRGRTGRKEVSQYPGPARQKTLSGLLSRSSTFPPTTIWKSYPLTRLSGTGRTGVGHRRWVRQDTPALSPQPESRTPSAPLAVPAFPNHHPFSATRPAFPPAPAEGAAVGGIRGGPGGIISPGGPGAAPRGLRLVTLPLNPAFPDAFPPGGAGVREGCNLCFLSLYFAVSKSTSSVRGGFEKGAAPGRFSAAARQGFGVGLRVRAGRRSEESAQSARRQLFSNQVKEGMRT